MLDKTVKRLEGFGYKLRVGDKAVLKFAVEKVTNTIKNECNVLTVPDGLINIAVDMAAGEFLGTKKAFSPADIAELNLEIAVKQVQVGDTSTVFAVGEGSLTPEQRFDLFVEHLLNYGRGELACYRKIRW